MTSLPLLWQRSPDQTHWLRWIAHSQPEWMRSSSNSKHCRVYQWKISVALGGKGREKTISEYGKELEWRRQERDRKVWGRKEWGKDEELRFTCSTQYYCCYCYLELIFIFMPHNSSIQSLILESGVGFLPHCKICACVKKNDSEKGIMGKRSLCRPKTSNMPCESAELCIKCWLVEEVMLGLRENTQIRNGVQTRWNK